MSGPLEYLVARMPFLNQILTCLFIPFHNNFFLVKIVKMATLRAVTDFI